jgi:hypothetical protein
MNTCQLTALISTLAIAIADSIPNNDDLGLLAASITQLGDTLDTISTQRALQDARNSSFGNSTHK